MKILWKNRKDNAIKVRVDNLDDLWYLSGIIRRGDLIRSKTERRIKSKDDIERSREDVRKTVTLSICVDKVELKLESNVLRISGTIEDGPEDIIPIGSYHTINILKGDALKIIKDRWSSLDLERLNDAEKATLRPKILIVVIDEGNATFGLVRESGIEYLELSKNIGGKYYRTERSKRKMEFYREIELSISNIFKRENVSTIILAGTGFEKDNFYDFLKEKNSEFIKIMHLENINSYGRTGINEVMKRPIMKKISEDMNAAKDFRMVNRLLKEIGKDSGFGIYGFSDVENAADMGAIDILLVGDDFFQKEREKVERLMKYVRSVKGRIHIVNHKNEAGKQLSSLGGIGAILRYKINR